MESWTIVKEVDKIGVTSRGDHKRGIKTEKGWLQLSGDLRTLESIVPGSKVSYDQPKQYGKSWYATLKSIEGGPQSNGAATHQGSAGNAPAAQSSKPNWKTYSLIVTAFHKIAQELEPDDITLTAIEGTPDFAKVTNVDRARARSAIMNTLTIALGRGDFEFTQDELDAIIPF